MNEVVYVLAVYVHVLTVVVWMGAMLFEDPNSVRMTSQIAHRIGGIGWYAQPVLWTTGFIMLNHRGVGLRELFSADFIASSWGRTLWAKIALVLVLLAFQFIVGNRPSKLVYGYILGAVAIVGLSVLLVRPIF